MLWDTILHYMELAMGIAQGVKRPGVQYAGTILKYLKDIHVAKKEHKPLVMVNFCFPPELIYAMECYPLNQELGSVSLSFANAGLKYIDVAEEHGVDKFQCNAQKVWIGASMLGEAPYPDYIVYGSQPCDSTNAQYQVLNQIYSNAPVYTIDVPYWHHDPSNKYYDPQTLPYVARQLKNLVTWLEERIDRKMDHDKFISTIQNSNQTRALMLDTMELMRAKPAPLPSMTAFNLFGLQLIAGGLPDTIGLATYIRDKARERVKKKQGALEAQGKEEKHRIMWVYLPIFFEPLLFNWLERKFGAVVVMDMMGYAMSQTINMKNDDTIFEGLAAQVLDTPMGRQSRGPAEYYIDDLLRIGRDYDADCAIYGGHIGCKHSHAIASLMKEIIEKELGIPCLIFEVDCVDSRPVTAREIKRKLKLFFKSLE